VHMHLNGKHRRPGAPVAEAWPVPGLRRLGGGGPGGATPRTPRAYLGQEEGQREGRMRPVPAEGRRAAAGPAPRQPGAGRKPGRPGA